MRFHKNILSILLYIFCGLVLACVFFLQTFPYKELEKRLEVELQDLTGQKIEVQALAFALPLGLGCERITAPGSGVTLNRVRLRVKPLSLLSGRLSAGLSLTALDGEAGGELGLSPLFSLDQVELGLNWQGVSLEQLQPAAHLTRVSSLSGTSSGELDLRLKRNSPLLASGRGEVRLEDGAAGISIPGVQELDFQEVRGRGTWTLEQGSLEVSGISFQAKGVKGRCSGTLELNRADLIRSRLQLEGDLQFTPAQPEAYSLAKKLYGKTSLGFSLLGDLAQPKYRLDS